MPFCWKTGRVSGRSSPIMTGTPGLMMPAFSPAMSAKVLPKNCTILTDICDDREDRGDNVGAVQATTESYFDNGDINLCSAKYLNARAVVNSKNDGCRGSKNLCSFLRTR